MAAPQVEEPLWWVTLLRPTKRHLLGLGRRSKCRFRRELARPARPYEIKNLPECEHCLAEP